MREERARRLYTALDGIEVPQPVDWEQPQAAAFRAAMNDDFNTPLAVAVLFDWRRAQPHALAAGGAAAQRGWARLGALQQRRALSCRAAGSTRERHRGTNRETAAAARRRGATLPKPTASATSWPRARHRAEGQRRRAPPG